MKVLIDRNIEINAITHKTVMVPQVLRWGRRDLRLEVTQRNHFPPREDERFRAEQLPCLAAVCACARTGELEFFSSHEIKMEMLRQRGRGQGYLGIDLLRNIPVKSVPCPIHRPVAITGAFESGTAEEEQMIFFRSIKHPRFLQIRKLTGDAHVDDAYHLWTAEEAKLDVFLTMDKKFWRVVNQKEKGINSPARVMTPKDLCERLGLRPIAIKQLAPDIKPFS
jgi:hypothetical protein